MILMDKVRARRWPIPVLGLIIVGAAIGAYFLFRPSTDTRVQEPQMQTATVRQGDLELRASTATLDAASAELSLAESALERTKDQLSQDPDNDMAKLNIANTEKRYNSALWSWNWYTEEPTNIQQDLLDAQLPLAQAKVGEAERDYALVVDGPDTDQVAKAEFQLENTIASREDAKSNLKKAIILAPFDSTILVVNASVVSPVVVGLVVVQA